MKTVPRDLEAGGWGPLSKLGGSRKVALFTGNPVEWLGKSGRKNSPAAVSVERNAKHITHALGREKNALGQVVRAVELSSIFAADTRPKSSAFRRPPAEISTQFYSLASNL